jgi:hypothetical protein
VQSLEGELKGKKTEKENLKDAMAAVEEFTVTADEVGGTERWPARPLMAVLLLTCCAPILWPPLSSLKHLGQSWPVHVNEGVMAVGHRS